MTIQTSVPSSTRTPGFYFEFNLFSAARGLTAIPRRIVCVAAQGSAATKVALTVNQCFTEADCDSFYEAGSELALMTKFALRSGIDYGVSAEVWGIGIADPAGTPAAATLTFVGTATAAGEYAIGIAGRRITVGIVVGDTETTAAARLDSRIQEQLAELPVTSAPAVGVVTLTAVNTGPNGNAVLVELLSPDVAGLVLTPVTSSGGATAYDITAALDVLNDKDYDIIALANNTTTDVTDLDNHFATMFLPGEKKWRQGMIALQTTQAAAQVIATAADDFKHHVISAEGFRNTPGEIAAYTGMVLASEFDPARPFNDVTLPRLALPDAADIPTTAELESGIGGGLFMLSVNAQQTQARIVRAVTTQVTLASAPFFEMLDTTIPRSLFFVARQIDTAQKLAFPQAKKLARTKRRVRSVALRVLKQIEQLEIVENVDAIAPQLKVEDSSDDPSIGTDRFNVSIPAQVVRPLNVVANVLNLLV